jgi:hypothetical protein
MLRFGFLCSVIPLVLVGAVAHDWTQASARQCAGLTASSARSMVFTDDPSLATVKVQLVEAAELADLAIVDERGADGSRGCGMHQAMQLFRIGTDPVPGAPVVYLTRETDADYRIYVDSPTISARQAAAMIVSARGGHMRLAAQSVDHEPTGSISR